MATLTAALLGGCAETLPALRSAMHLPPHEARAVTHPPIKHDLPALPAAGSGRGGYYQDDGPGDAAPANLRDIPDAQVRAEPLSRFANRPYTVFGKTYTPLIEEQPYAQRGMGSWYGKKFHGQKTSSGEIYDMYKMTAAHPTLPIPSFARVTHVASGKQVVVRINDRGPFHAGRVVDLSYTAALKLGLLSAGSQEVQIERVLANAPERLATLRRNAPEMAMARPPPLAARDEIAALILTNKAEIKAEKAHAGQAEEAPLAALAAPQALAAPAEAALVSGFWVQLGAFSRPDKAAETRARIAGQGWAPAALDVVVAGALHKVLSGPFASRAEALDAVRGLPSALGLKPIVIKR
ncbi:MAG: septal ring lytic transglycosylase RlpA family protein [Massilia sp.]|nr:septal ring lytic transglycosylase RlpA family protein [Massilia sp.]